MTVACICLECPQWGLRQFLTEAGRDKWVTEHIKATKHRVTIVPDRKDIPDHPRWRSTDAAE